MTRISKFVLFFALLEAGAGLSLEGAVLKAGVAKVEITPPAGLTMWGYRDRTGPAAGVLDPLYARVLVIECGDKRLAIVTLDLGRTFGPPLLGQLRKTVKQTTGIAYVLIAASHTHSGPVILDEYPSGSTSAWESACVEKIAGAIHAAHQNAVEARLGAGFGAVSIAHNRRLVNPDGNVTMLWRNVSRAPTFPVDSTVSVLRVDTAAGRPLAILAGYSCHPTIFGPDNLKYSADFPAATTAAVEKAFDGKPLCFFLQGAPGDIDPDYDETAIAEDGEKMCVWTGQQLGKEVIRVAKDIQTDSASNPDLAFSEELLTFRLRWSEEKFREGLAALGSWFVESFAPRIRDTWQLPVATVLINKRIALMTMPGEPFVEFQISWRDRCPVRDAFFLGYANGYYGYFPTIRAASEGGYGAAGATTWIEVGAGERMVNHALTKVYEMLGRLKDFPVDAKD